MNTRNPNSDYRDFADPKPLEFEELRISPGSNPIEFDGIGVISPKRSAL